MATPRKTKSGKWHIRVYSHTDSSGKRIYKSITANSKTECEQLALDFREFRKNPPKTVEPVTVGQIIDMYIDLSEPTLSPSTIAQYRHIRSFAFQEFMQYDIHEIDDIVAQRAVNEECKRISYAGRKVTPKTVQNEWGLVSSALRRISHIDIHVTLPKQARNINEFPKPREVISAVMGTSIELPCMLAIWLSFSMSEIRGIRYSSIRNNNIYIEQVVIDVNSLPVVKDVAKADTRIRKHEIPSYIADLLAKDEGYQQYLKDGVDGYLVPLTGNQLSKRFMRLMEKNNIDLTFHGLRHLNASVMLALAVPDKYAMERGGWKTTYVMKTVYQHTLTDERKKVDREINQYFENLIAEIER